MTKGHTKNKKFITSRTEFWRTRGLEPTFLSTLENIEQYGCAVMHVKGDHVAPAFSYTVGVYETTGKPEIVQVGLLEKTAHYALNEAAERSRAGTLTIDQRESEIIGKVDCIFRSVEERWIQQLMYRAQWFYNDLPFPAMQCIYPDLENRFPWEAGFDESWRKRQALLFEGVEWTGVEKDLWAANDPDSILSRWKWLEAPHTQAYVRESVADQKEPVLTVHHDPDGDWQFHGATEDGCVLLCLHHLIDRDRTLDELADLPRGWSAWRDSSSAPWNREPYTPSDDE